MGMSYSSDEFCRRSDAIMEGLEGVRKLVDDILIQGPIINILLRRIKALLERCREEKFILSQKKFEIGTSVTFAGFEVGHEGVLPHRDKAQGISDFATPTNVTELRSFLGMVNQMNAFYPYPSRRISSLQLLLKKDVAFTWLPEHQEAFEEVKRELARGLALHHFDSTLPTSLVTDSSKTGIGLALIQNHQSGSPRIVQCGSRLLTPAEKNYAVIELEALAIVWAINKANFYLMMYSTLRGFAQDHRPLMGVFAKSLAQLENKRLARIREKVLDFHFDVVWKPGKENHHCRHVVKVQQGDSRLWGRAAISLCMNPSPISIYGPPGKVSPGLFLIQRHQGCHKQEANAGHCTQGPSSPTPAQCVGLPFSFRRLLASWTVGCVQDIRADCSPGGGLEGDTQGSLRDRKDPSDG